MLPMAAGLLCQVEYWFGAGYFDFGGIEGNWSGIAYSLLMSLWSVYFLATWCRLEGELGFVWGTEHVVTHDSTRYAFTKNEENPLKYNPLTEINERSYGSRIKRAAKFVPTLIFVSLTRSSQYGLPLSLCVSLSLSLCLCLSLSLSMCYMYTGRSR